MRGSSSVSDLCLIASFWADISVQLRSFRQSGAEDRAVKALVLV